MSKKRDIEKQRDAFMFALMYLMRKHGLTELELSDADFSGLRRTTVEAAIEFHPSRLLIHVHSSEDDSPDEWH